MIRRFTVSLTALLAGTLLTACGSVTIPIPGADGDSVSVRTDGDGEFTVKGDGGSVTGGGVGKLPDGFPADDVPLIEGRITTSLAVNENNGRKAWTVTIAVDGGVAEAAEQATAPLVAAGYTVALSLDGEQAASRNLTSGTWTVSITVAPGDGDEAMVSYTVIPTEQG